MSSPCCLLIDAAVAMTYLLPPGTLGRGAVKAGIHAALDVPIVAGQSVIAMVQQHAEAALRCENIGALLEDPDERAEAGGALRGWRAGERSWCLVHGRVGLEE
jgi:hypothetical protein